MEGLGRELLMINKLVAIPNKITKLNMVVIVDNHFGH